MIPDFEVVIIGAGVAGLAIARGLHNADKSFHLFEARERSGGRALSTPVQGGVADLGPTWFWRNESRVNSLVAEFGLATHDQFTDGDTMVLFNNELSRFDGFTLPHAFRFSKGSQSLTNALEQTIPTDSITFNTPVSGIEKKQDHVLIHTSSGSVTASTVVIAMPPSLAISRGMIDPGSLATSVADAATHIPVWMGGITKTVAVYKSAFWRDQGLSGVMRAPGSLFGEVHDMSGPDGSPAMLFGFGQTLNGVVPDETAFVKQLSTAFGVDAENPIEVISHNWLAEEFTTPASGNNSQRYDLFGSSLLRTPSWDGQLHWASAESGAVAPGHIEGALQAAERVVGAVS